MQSWVHQAGGLPREVGQDSRAYLLALFQEHVDPGLAWLRNLGSEYMPSVDIALVTSLATLLQVHIVTGLKSIEHCPLSLPLQLFPQFSLSHNASTDVLAHTVTMLAQSHTPRLHWTLPIGTSLAQCSFPLLILPSLLVLGYSDMTVCVHVTAACNWRYTAQHAHTVFASCSSCFGEHI